MDMGGGIFKNLQSGAPYYSVPKIISPRSSVNNRMIAVPIFNVATDVSYKVSYTATGPFYSYKPVYSYK